LPSFAASLLHDIKTYLTTDEPLISLSVTSFSDATLVGITIPHAVSDGMGAANFLQAWSSVQDGQPPKPVSGARDDVMAHIGKSEGKNDRVKFVLEDDQIHGLGLFAFLCRRAWDNLTQRKISTGHIYIPDKFMRHLRLQASEELGDRGRGEGATFVSDGDLITAWAARKVLATFNGPGSIVNMFDIRARLTDCFSSDASYLHNAFLPYVTLLSSKEARQSNTQVAIRIRQSLIDQSTQVQVQSLIRLTRKWLASLGSLPLFARWNSRVVSFSNWGKANFFATPNFRSAISPAKDGLCHASGIRQGCPTMVMATLTGVKMRDTLVIYGKDQWGNYWLRAYLRPETWLLIQQEFDEFI
jgi:hypothetical protein